MNNYLTHHGIKGQRWGVRRFQNVDGTYTADGKNHRQLQRNIVRNRLYTDDVNDIVRTLSDTEKDLLGASSDEEWIDKQDEKRILANKAKTFLSKQGDTPVAFVEIWTNGGRKGQIALATRNDPDFRGKGYASKEVKKAMDWCERYGKTSIDELEWIAEKTNTASRRLAEKYGFEYDVEESDNHHDGLYAFYRRKLN